MILLASIAKVRRAAVDLAACCCVWCSGRRAAAPAPSRRPAASGQRSYAPPAQPRRLFAVSLLLSGWRSWLRCRLLRSVRRWVRVRVGRAVRLVRFAVSLFCAGCMGFTPGVSVLRRFGALFSALIPTLSNSEDSARAPKASAQCWRSSSRERATWVRPKTARGRCLGLHGNIYSRSRLILLCCHRGAGGAIPGLYDKVGAFAHSLHEAQQAPTGWRRSFVAARPAANSGQGLRATKKDPRQG